MDNSGTDKGKKRDVDAGDQRFLSRIRCQGRGAINVAIPAIQFEQALNNCGPGIVVGAIEFVDVGELGGEVGDVHRIADRTVRGADRGGIRIGLRGRRGGRFTSHCGGCAKDGFETTREIGISETVRT